MATRMSDRLLRAALSATNESEANDRELLRRFVHGDETGFEDIVHRHTGMVLGACRRMLPTLQDAEDACQATFLILARKVRTTRWQSSIANWLYTTARRVAFNASRAAARRMKLESTAAPSSPPSTLDQMTGREAFAALDEELDRLPAIHREPLVLCYLQGLTRDEAARRLGVGIATLKCQLERGRKKLAHALTRRGIALGFGLTTVAATSTASAAPRLVKSILAAIGGSPSMPVAALASRFAANWLSMKTKWLALGSLAAAMTVFGLVSMQIAAEPPTPTIEKPVPPLLKDNATKDSAAAPKDTANEPGSRVDRSGDPLPKDAVARLGTVRFRHDAWVMHAVWSPDGKFIASSAGLTLIVWDAQTGREYDRVTFAKPAKQKQEAFGDNEISALAWSPAGHQILAAYGLELLGWNWDASKNRFGTKQSWRREVAWNGLQYLPDGRTILCASGNAVELISAADGKSIRTFKTGEKPLSSFSLSSTGKMLATACEDKPIRLWDVASGMQQRTLEVEGKVSKLSFSSDGKQVAAGYTSEGKSIMKVWDATSAKSVIRIEYPVRAKGSSEIRHIVFSPDDRELVSSSADHTVRWWNLETGKETKKIGPLPNPLLRIAFRADGRVLMTVCPENHIRLWDTATDKELPLPVGPAWSAHAAAFTPDGRKALITSYHAVHIYDSVTGKELHQLTGHAGNQSDALVTPDGKTVIAGGVDGKILFWDLESGKEVKRLQAPKYSYMKLALSPDGKLLAVATSDPTRKPILIWDVASGKQVCEIALPPKPELYAIYRIGFTPDGSGIYFCSGTDLNIPVFEVATGRLLYSLQETNGGVPAAEISADGRMMAAASMGHSLYFWEIATGRKRLVLHDSGRSSAIAWSPNGRVLALINDGMHFGSSPNGQIERAVNRSVVRLIDPFSGKELHRLEGHQGNVDSIVWSPDGKRVLSGSADSTGLIWEVPAWMYLPAKDQKIETATLKKLWEVLGTDDAEAAYQAIGKLIRSPAATQALIREKIKPVTTPDAGTVQRWINDLDNEKFAIRDRAAKGLQGLGEAAAPLLQAALGGKLSIEVRGRIEQMLAELKSSASRITAGRALEVLERIGGDESLKILTALAKGNEKSWLTHEASSALNRCKRGLQAAYLTPGAQP